MNSPKIWYNRLKRNLPFWVQRRTRGWDDSETWSLDYSFACWFVPRLARYREITIGIPGAFDPEYNEDIADWDEAEALWHKILWDMQVGFQVVIDEKGWPMPDSEEAKRLDHALDLFREYFGALWW
jgi:hypothetical protein